MKGGVQVEKQMDSGSNFATKKGHSQMGTGFFKRSLWQEGWGAGSPKWQEAGPDRGGGSGQGPGSGEEGTKS